MSFTSPLTAGLDRRSLLRLALAGAGVAATGPVLARTGLIGSDGVSEQGTVNGVINHDSPMDGPNVPKFTRDLVIPPVLKPTSSSETTDYYDLRHEVTTQQILPAPFPKTQIYSYNGIVPGPTIVQYRNGKKTQVKNYNGLPAGHPYSMHLHGSPSQPIYDGHPDDLTQPGESKTYKYPNSEESRTLWYHDHAMHQTADHVYKGLAGFFLQYPSAEDIAKYGLDKLPKGKYDVPLLVADMQFDTRGNVKYDDKGDDSLWGNVNVVNGIAYPNLKVDRTRYRFRILVASVSRGFNFKLSNSQVMQIIATDAGLLPAPVSVTSYRHGMAERYEVVIDFTNLAVGTKVTLNNTAGDGPMRQVMQFEVTGPIVPSSPVPDKLNDVVFPKESDVVATREFRFDRSNGMWTINGLPWNGKVAAAPKIGDTEKWILQNNSGGWFHPIHIHLVDFQILRRNGAGALPYEKGWKDVAYIGPNERVEVLMTFHEADRVDPEQPTTGKYVMHCHNLVHEDHDMMNQFETQPKAGATTVAAAASHGGMKMDANAPSMMVQWDLQA